MSNNIIVQLLSDNTQLYNMYSKMMSKNLANINQCDRYKALYRHAEKRSASDHDVRRCRSGPWLDGRDERSKGLHTFSRCFRCASSTCSDIKYNTSTFT